MAANPEQPSPSDRTSLRDAGLRRVRHASRWLAGGAVVLTGAFAGIAATSSKQTTTTSTTTSAGGGSTQPQTQRYEQDDDGGATLQAPAQAPQQAPSTSAPQSSSGAS